jgi:hypothetical protein
MRPAAPVNREREGGGGGGDTYTHTHTHTHREREREREMVVTSSVIARVKRRPHVRGQGAAFNKLTQSPSSASLRARDASSSSWISRAADPSASRCARWKSSLSVELEFLSCTEDACSPSAVQGLISSNSSHALDLFVVMVLRSTVLIELRMQGGGRAAGQSGGTHSMPYTSTAFITCAPTKARSVGWAPGYPTRKQIL